MAAKRLVVIGASSGGIEALRVVVAGLPAQFPAAVAIVIHTSPDSPGLVQGILERVSTLPVAVPQSGAALEAGRVYVAPPDHHLVVEPGHLRLTKGPRENRSRPAIDPLFRSAAQIYGPAAIGVILTGSLDDGTSGLWAIKRLGGIAVVQDPDDALYPSMPSSAIANVDVDHIVALSGIAPLLARLAATHPKDLSVPLVPKSMEIEVNIAKEQNAVDAGVEQIGEPSSISCPDCHGVLLRLKDERPVRYRCHTGHAFSADSLVAAINHSIEEALWSAVRSLQEGQFLMEHLSAHLQGLGITGAELLAARAVAARQDAEAVRAVASARVALDDKG